jgi:hypothetical protein
MKGSPLRVSREISVLTDLFHKGHRFSWDARLDLPGHSRSYVEYAAVVRNRLSSEQEFRKEGIAETHHGKA